jgi:hypothetical protein
VAEPKERPPLVVALEWVSKITTVSLEMVLPGVAGVWLDQRWDTSFMKLIGFAFGVTVGVLHLIVLTRTENGKDPKQPRSEKTGTDDEER